MRLIIKGADFSSVSIGKVVKDLSFAIHGSDGNDALNAFFVNYNSGSPTSVTYYNGSSGDESLGQATNANRITSDFIPVIQGMKISSFLLPNTATVPLIVAFDSSKNALADKSAWASGNLTEYTVPSGVAYVKIQGQLFGTTMYVTGEMPK